MTCRRPRVILLVAATMVASACQDVPPLAPLTGVPDPGLLGLPGALLRCDPVTADSVTQVVGPEGGLVLVGPHRLVIPPGALSAPTPITAIAPSDTVNVVRLMPDGLTFAVEARLRMSYANCDGALAPLPKRIAYVDDTLVILDLLVSLDHVATQSVTTRLAHFSNYAVAW